MNIIRTWYVLRAPLQPGRPPLRLPRMEIVTVYPEDVHAVHAEIKKWESHPKGLDYRVEVVLTEKERDLVRRKASEAQARVNAHAEAVRAEIFRLR